MAYIITFEAANGTIANAATVADDQATAEVQAAHKFRMLHGEPLRIVAVKVLDGE